MHGVRSGGLFATVAVMLLFGPIAVALADSGGATVSTLPESESLQVSLEVHHSCISVEEGEGCYWFAEAAAYSASSSCPFVYDSSHGVWVGEVETVAGTSYGHFAFSPVGLEQEILVCLYVHSGSESTLVGESHPFDRSAGREVLPQAPRPPPPPPRYPARTSVWVRVHGCFVTPHIRVNGEQAIGGDFAWGLDQLRRKRWVRIDSGKAALNKGLETVEESRGTYRLSVRFLGDANLYASSRSASATYRVTGRC